MLVKTFQAAEMSEALRMVKAEMGLDAMILSSKKERRKGIMGYFSKPYFEVTAALDPRPAPAPKAQREDPPQRDLSTREEFQNSMLGPLARELRELKLKVEALSRREEGAAMAQPQGEGGEPEAAKVLAREDLEELKKLLYNAFAARDTKEPKPVVFPAAGAAAEEILTRPVATGAVQLAAGVLERADEEVATAHEKSDPPQHEQEILAVKPGLLEQLAAELRGEDLSTGTVDLLIKKVRPVAGGEAGIYELRGLLREVLAEMVKCAGPQRKRRTGARIMALVGPTGAGKTTTIAKLAAVHAVNRGHSVALVTTDTFRAGAAEQLKAYAKIMDLPLELAANPQELQEALARHADKDLVLVDTAGRSPKDAERIEELKGYLEGIGEIETYLCLSATTKPRELNEVVASFGKLPGARLLFTKLDESESFGCMVETQLKHKLPLSYFTTGQKVPEDIEVATGSKVASLVVKESA